MQNAINDNRQKKIARANVLFKELYCFTSAEINDFMAKAAMFPEDGLDKLIALLEDGKKQQDELLARRIGKDKNYLYNLSKFLNKTTAKIKNQWEENESKKAEDLLYDL